MDDGEVDFSNHDLFSDQYIGDQQLNGSSSMDSFFDELFKDSHACTHTHTCNPPGPDLSHTHTCFHVHTKLLPLSASDKATTDDTSESTEKDSKKRPLGNREAVRKYREKKKARTASLEDEVVRLRALNQQLMKRLQGQAALEAEIARLKCLLVDIRGRIEGEIGSFPYQKLGKGVDGISNPTNNLNLSSGYVLNSCNLKCNEQVYCLHPGLDGRSGQPDGSNGQDFGGCDIGNIHCMGNSSFGSKELLGCESGNVGPATGDSSTARKRKGARS
eukprot:TRINITY_DN1167_c0_g1_i2.p1 TRINITY_DN1167_c0_g1~~TRINITY_DN1167_c0_g1_i2.p1  ORF type:complete len:274 (-),score=54.53 TRINITY_DN1167_c0_g1_i2:2453-3274(-)